MRSLKIAFLERRTNREGFALETDPALTRMCVSTHNHPTNQPSIPSNVHFQKFLQELVWRKRKNTDRVIRSRWCDEGWPWIQGKGAIVNVSSYCSKERSSIGKFLREAGTSKRFGLGFNPLKSVGWSEGGRSILSLSFFNFLTRLSWTVSLGTSGGRLRIKVNGRDFLTLCH